jgi:HTH-type transcriptional regulator/antitoxin HipB
MATVHNQRELGAAIRDRRHNLGWTQAALASKVGVTRDWVIDLEAGQGNPQLRHLLRALDILGLRLTVERDWNDQDAPFESKRAAERPERRIHRGLPVVDLDEVLDAHRRRG